MEQDYLMGVMVLTLGTIVAVTIIIQLAATWRARMSAAREENYRQLAERATAALAENTKSRKQVERELADIRAKLASIDHVLRQVE
jgi:hypothetical protein